MLLVTKSQFSERADVSGAAISKACAVGGTLAAAVVGKRIDASHPAAITYLTKHGGEQFVPDPGSVQAPPAIPAPVVDARVGATHVRGPKAAKEQRKQEAGNNVPDDLPSNIEAFLDMTLRTIVTKFGTDVRFTDWLKSTKTIEEIRGKRFQNAELMGDLIPRDYVQAHVFGLFEELNVRLLNDAPPTITSASLEAVKAGKNKEEVEAEVRDIISKQLQNAKAKLVKVVRNA